MDNSMTPEELIKAYNQTLFKVNGFNEPITIGKISEEADHLLNETRTLNWIYITAHNPQSKTLSKTENENRNLQLKEKIKTFAFKEGIGIDSNPKSAWIGENSFLVPGMQKEEAILLGVAESLFQLET